MAIAAATHSGPFHADDVLAWGLIQVFVDAEATLVRTRDAERLEQADIVFDVGGIYDPSSGRFDHHQNSYIGPLSSAGMVLDWLEASGRVEAPSPNASEPGVHLCRRCRQWPTRARPRSALLCVDGRSLQPGAKDPPGLTPRSDGPARWPPTLYRASPMATQRSRLPDSWSRPPFATPRPARATPYS